MPPTSPRLAGKIAIVTGASRGIGAAIAQAFAREGARVVLTSRKLPGLEASAAAINADLPDAAFPRACHVGNPDEIRALVDWTVATLGVPDILVNNAATNPHFGPMLGVDMGAWDKTFEVNLKGTFEATRAVASALSHAGKPGAIVNVASIVGIDAAPLQGVYGMTKAAIISMTRTLAVELAAANIRVNAIAPGLVDTRFAAAIVQSAELRDRYNDRTALQRYARPEELAGAAVFLASDESSYVTGQVLRVDGGHGLR